MNYISRILDEELSELIEALPAIAIEGAKGVGKTETALQRAKTVFRLDDPAVRSLAEADPTRLTEGAIPVLLDEWQRVPSVWDRVRRAVDAGAPPASYLLTGSAAPTRRPTHSGAGRIVTLRMRPLSLAERLGVDDSISLRDLLSGSRPRISGACGLSLADYAQEVVDSGFPGIRHLGARALRAQLDGYIERIVDTDFDEAGRPVRRPRMLRQWMSAYAAATATDANWETIRDAATPGEADKPAKSTTLPYREVLGRLWILDPLPAWTPSRNPISRLIRSPKHHLVDPALAARLLGIGVDALLTGQQVGPAVPRDGTLLGHLFESLVALSVRVYAQAAECRVSHLRTAGGQREVDLIVERRDRRVVAIEVKLKSVISDRDVRHLLWLREQLKDELLDAVVLTTGTHAYRRNDGIAVIPAGLLTA